MVQFYWLDQLSAEQETKWRGFLLENPYRHPYQDPDWGKITRDERQEPHYAIGEADGAIVFVAQVLIRRLRMFHREQWRIPRGPVCADSAVLMAGLDFISKSARRKRALSCVVNPYWKEPCAIDRLLAEQGWQPNLGDGMHWSSLEINLRRDVDAILHSFRQTTRHEIVKAERAGLSTQVATRPEELETWFKLYRAHMTSKELGHSPRRFFNSLWRMWLSDQRGGALILATYNDRIEAGALVLKYGNRAWYTYGAHKVGSRLPCGHLALWHAILWARDAGCEWFDLGGWDDVPKTSPLYGVVLFKEGFSKQVVRFPREHLKVFSPRAYRAFVELLKLRQKMRR